MNPLESLPRSALKRLHSIPIFGTHLAINSTASGVASLCLPYGPTAVVRTTDMNIRFLAPCRSDANAEARVIKYGNTLCPVSVNISGQHGLVAVAQVRYMQLR